MIKILNKMEEDNDEITGWDDNEVNILNAKFIKKHKKKMTHSIVTQDEPVERKIRASRTLPFIKNIPTYLDYTAIELIQKKQPTHLDKLQRILEERMDRPGKGIVLKEYLESLDSFHTSQKTQKQQQKVLLEEKDLKQPEGEHSSSIHKKLGQVKHGSTIVKTQKISQLEKLKIQANDYISSTKNSPRINVEMLKKINKSSLANLNKKEKNKYFVVKKQRLSPEQVSEEVSKMAIQLRKFNDQELKLPPQKQRKGYFMKEKYKDVIRPTEQEKEKEKEKKIIPMLIKSQSQQLKNTSHVRRNTYIEMSRSNNKSNSRNNACKESSFSECVGLKQQDLSGKKVNKWDQVLREVENEAKTLKKLKDHQKKLFKAAQQASTGLLPNFNQKTHMLEMMLTKRLRKDIINSQSRVINNIKGKLMKQLNQEDRYIMKKEKTTMTEESTRYDEFNDEFLFCNRGNKQDIQEAKIY